MAPIGPSVQISSTQSRFDGMSLPKCFWHIFAILFLIDIEYWNDDVTKNFFFCTSAFEYHVLVEHDKNIYSPNLVEICSWGSEIWPLEYVISPIGISVNWPGSSRPIFTLLFLLKYGHESAVMQKWKFDDVTLRYPGTLWRVGYNNLCLCRD